MANTKAIESTITDLIKGDLTTLGYDLVRVQLTPGGRYYTLQIMAERKDRKAMTVNDCVQISGTLSPRIDAAGVLVEDYTLEISSPGIERPLMQVEDYRRFTGHVARIELAAPEANGQRRFQGKIVRVTGNKSDAEIELKTESGEVRLPARAISKGKLVLTEAELNKSKDNTKH